MGQASSSTTVVDPDTACHLEGGPNPAQDVRVGNINPARLMVKLKEKYGDSFKVEVRQPEHNKAIVTDESRGLDDAQCLSHPCSRTSVSRAYPSLP